MVRILESTLLAISRRERERSLTLEERLMLVMQHGARGWPSFELLRYQTEDRYREHSKTVNRCV